jgi:hypothetical protein
MTEHLSLVKPGFVPPLDEGFRPAVLANQRFQKEVEDSGMAVPLVLGGSAAVGKCTWVDL